MFPVSVTRSEHTTDYNYLTEDNYQYLLASVRRYAELLGVELGHVPGSTPGESITNLYHELATMVGPEVSVNIETDGTMLVFVLWRYHRWGEYNYYWIPVKFVESLNPALRRIAISFLHQFMRTNGFDNANDSGEFEMSIEWFRERSTDPHEDSPEMLAAIADDYDCGGKVCKLMERIKKKNYYKRLDLALDRYVPQSDYESELLALMKRGLQFIGKDKPSITSYAYDPFRDEKNDDYEAIGPDCMFMLTYDVNCDLEIEIRSGIQESINNGYEVCPCSILFLRPDENEVFKMDDYPAELYKYLDDLLNFLTEGPAWTRMY